MLQFLKIARTQGSHAMATLSTGYFDYSILDALSN